jgi:DNA-binding GntR family transcriptional regulator
VTGVVPQRQILSDGVYDAIKQMLMEHSIAPGLRVNIDQLARQLNVSQTPVREALARLEADALVVKEPLRGYTAAPLLDLRALRECRELRLLLEPQAAARAASGLEAHELEELGRTLIQMRAAGEVHSREERHLFAAHDSRFHEIIATAGGNRLIRDVLNRIRPHVQMYRVHYQQAMGRQTIAEHQRVLDALRARDAAAAEEAMATHIDRAYDRLEVALGPQDAAQG